MISRPQRRGTCHQLCTAIIRQLYYEERPTIWLFFTHHHIHRSKLLIVNRWILRPDVPKFGENDITSGLKKATIQNRTVVYVSDYTSLISGHSSSSQPKNVKKLKNYKTNVLTRNNFRLLYTRLTYFVTFQFIIVKCSASWFKQDGSKFMPSSSKHTSFG